MNFFSSLKSLFEKSVDKKPTPRPVTVESPHRNHGTGDFPGELLPFSVLGSLEAKMVTLENPPTFPCYLFERRSRVWNLHYVKPPHPITGEYWMPSASPDPYAGTR